VFSTRQVFEVPQGHGSLDMPGGECMTTIMRVKIFDTSAFTCAVERGLDF